jgi:hypothetical protein
MIQHARAMTEQAYCQANCQVLLLPTTAAPDNLPAAAAAPVPARPLQHSSNSHLLCQQSFKVHSLAVQLGGEQVVVLCTWYVVRNNVRCTKTPATTSTTRQQQQSPTINDRDTPCAMWSSFEAIMACFTSSSSCARLPSLYVSSSVSSAPLPASRLRAAAPDAPPDPAPPLRLLAALKRP